MSTGEVERSVACEEVDEDDDGKIPIATGSASASEPASPSSFLAGTLAASPLQRRRCRPLSAVIQPSSSASTSVGSRVTIAPKRVAGRGALAEKPISRSVTSDSSLDVDTGESSSRHGFEPPAGKAIRTPSWSSSPSPSSSWLCSSSESESESESALVLTSGVVEPLSVESSDEVAASAVRSFACTGSRGTCEGCVRGQPRL